MGSGGNEDIYEQDVLTTLREHIEVVLQYFQDEVSKYMSMDTEPPGEGVAHVGPDDSDDEINSTGN